MTELDKNLLDTYKNEVLRAAQLHEPVGGKPFALVDEKTKAIDLEKFLSNPSRSRGHVSLLTECSFISYIKNQGSIDTTDIYFKNDVNSPSVFAVINASRPNLPSWGDKTCSYEFPYSEEWKVWTGSDGVEMPQNVFALFVERNIKDIHDPIPAKLLDACLKIKHSRNIDITSNIRLDNGEVEFHYKEEVRGNQKEDLIRIPEKIKIATSVLRDGTVYYLEAFLRYRITKEGIVFFYDLIDKHLLVQQAIKESFEKAEKELEGAHIYYGHKPSFD